MTEVVVDVAVHPGETLSHKIAQVISIPEIRVRQDHGTTQILRGMHTCPHPKLSNYYTIHFQYEPTEE